MKMPFKNFTWKHGLLLTLLAVFVYCYIYSCQLNLDVLNQDVQLKMDGVATDPTTQTVSAGASVSVGVPQLNLDSSPAGYSPSMNFGTL